MCAFAAPTVQRRPAKHLQPNEAEREREAKEFRATGEEEAQKIRADAEKTHTVISQAQREAQQTRGEGDGEAIKIYAESFGQDAEFFAFYRSMEAYRKSMATATPRWSFRPTAASSLLQGQERRRAK